jgi:chromosome partitioning protein
MKLLLGSQKGGPGKSTLAINFATMLARQGRDVLLIDSDPQRSAALWVALRERAGLSPRITCMSAYGELLYEEINKVAPKFDDVVIDTAGHTSEELVSAMLTADILVTPAEVALFSTATLGEMQRTIKKCRMHNRNLRALLVPNRISTHATRGQSQLLRIAEAAENLNEFMLSGAPLRERVAYSEVLESGKIVAEGTDHKAISEIEALFKEVQHVAK